MCTTLVLDWYQVGSTCVQHWYQICTILVPCWYQIDSTCVQHSIRVLPDWCYICTKLVPDSIRFVPDWYHIRTTLIADSNQIGTIMPCGAMWCGVVFRGGGVLELVIGFSGFYLQLYRDSNSSPLRFEANAMLLYNAHPVRIRTKG